MNLGLNRKHVLAGASVIALNFGSLSATAQSESEDAPKRLETVEVTA